jgi:hypothetical protein
MAMYWSMRGKARQLGAFDAVTYFFLLTRRWRNVLIDPKEVIGIEFTLDPRKAVIFVSIGGTNSSFALVLQVVYVHCASQERLHCMIELLNPSP